MARRQMLWSVVRVSRTPPKSATGPRGCSTVKARRKYPTWLGPPGATPPLILRFNASSVPILRLGLGGQVLSEQALYDIGSNFLPTQLATVQGASVLQPAGGKARQIMVDLHPKALYARGVSPADVSAAINAQSPILPAGAAKLGDREYSVRLNNSPDAAELLNDIPVRQQGGATVYLRDVAQVRRSQSYAKTIINRANRRGQQLSGLPLRTSPAC